MNDVLCRLFENRCAMTTCVEHDHRLLERTSPTAVCLAGEARTMRLAPLRTRLRTNLIGPLNGDLFLVMSPAWKNNEAGQTFTSAALRAVKEELQPVSLVLARDEEMMPLLTNRSLDFGISAGELHAISRCTHEQPLPQAIANDDRSSGGLGVEWRRTNDQTGPCSPQLALALRFRACLGLVELAERKRDGLAYRWVVRSRPDVNVICPLPVELLALLTARHMALYQDDFIAVMPRAAAAISMRQVPLARRLNASACFVDIMRAQPEAVTREEDGDFAYW